MTLEPLFSSISNFFLSQFESKYDVTARYGFSQYRPSHSCICYGIWKDKKNDIIIKLKTRISLEYITREVLIEESVEVKNKRNKSIRQYDCNEVPTGIIETLSSRIQTLNEPIPEGLKTMLTKIGIQNFVTYNNLPKPMRRPLS